MPRLGFPGRLLCNAMNQNISLGRMTPWKVAALSILVIALGLVAFGCYTGQPVFFLKWFFGLQADD